MCMSSVILFRGDLACRVAGAPTTYTKARLLNLDPGLKAGAFIV
jgi:hypothetical protein